MHPLGITPALAAMALLLATAAHADTALLGHAARSADGKESGRIIDIVVSPSGVPVSAVVDLGGFMGVGDRHIAVDWARLRFDAAPDAPVIIDMTTDELRAAPDYKEPVAGGH